MTIANEVNTSGLAVEITRVVDAPRERVFAAWVDADELARWWGPREGGADFTAPSVVADARVGGSYQICIRSPRGKEYWMGGEYREVERPGRLAFTHRWAGQHREDEGVIEVDFDDVAEGRTRITFRKSGFGSPEARDGEVEGWHECLDRLVGHFAGGNRADDEAAIRGLIAEWSRALEAKDVERLLASYAPDVVLFDVKPPYKVVGREGIRRVWEQCLPCFPEKFESERREEELVVGGDAAFYRGLHHIKPIQGHGAAGMTWIRVTVCYRKVAGQWVVAHEHVSVPFDPMTGQVAFITEPGK